MTDYGVFQRGGTAFPLVSATTNSLLQDADPSIYYALDFFKAMITTHAGARIVAQAAVCGATQIANAVQQIVPFDPHPVLTQEQFKFPLLAVYRKSAKFPKHTTAIAHNIDQWGASYSLPPLTAGQMEQLVPALHAVAAILDDRIAYGFDPTYQSGAKVWSLAGLEAISLDEASYGNFTDIEGTLYFPTVTLSLTVTERQNPVNSQFSVLAGIDVKETVQGLDLVDFKTG